MEDNNGVMKTAVLCLRPIMTRRPTDKFFILLLPINFVLWLGIGIYEVCLESERTRENDPRRTNKPKKDYGDLDLMLLRSLLNITIYALVSAVIIILFLFVTTALKAKSIVYMAMSLIVITIVSCIMLIPWELVLLISDNSHSPLLIIAIAATILYLIYQVTIFVCTKGTNVILSAELISKSCEAILHSFTAVLASLALAFLSIVVLMITMSITLSKTFDAFSVAEFYRKRLIQERALPNNLDLLRISIFFIGGIYIFNFIWNFGLMAMGDYSAHFYAISNNQKSSNVDVFQSIKKVASYHLGTLALLSTPILPSICAITVAFKTNRKFNAKSCYKSINFFSKMCLIVDISDYALAHTSIYGYKSLKSITEMFDLHQRSSLLFLTLNAISTKAIEICIVVATIIGMIIRIFSVPTYHDIPFIRLKDNVTEEMIFYEIFMAAIYVNVMCKSVTRSAMCTFSIYQMASVRMSETLEDHIAIAEQSM